MSCVFALTADSRPMAQAMGAATKTTDKVIMESFHLPISAT